MVKSDEFREILYRALAEPIGLLLSCQGDRASCRQRLYRVRAELQDSDLDCLQIRVSPFGEGDLVIVKSKVQPGASSPQAVLTLENTK